MSIGCVQRRMTVRSNPPGALVYVDDYQIGTTPVSTDFVYYGTRKIRLIKDGYDTLTVQQPFPVPWYEIFPLDFVTENLWPWEIRDERVVDLAMVPAGTIPAETVVSRAELARRSAGSGPPVPVGGALWLGRDETLLVGGGGAGAGAAAAAARGAARPRGAAQARGRVGPRDRGAARRRAHQVVGRGD